MFLISGAVPPAHFIGGYQSAVSERQPPMYFRLGGGTIKGVSKPGHDCLEPRVCHGRQIALRPRRRPRPSNCPDEETERRWRETTPQWPIMHAVLDGITRDQMMSRHKANHVQVVYVPNEKEAHRALCIKAVTLATLGLEVHLCGNVDLI